MYEILLWHSIASSKHRHLLLVYMFLISKLFFILFSFIKFFLGQFQKYIWCIVFTLVLHCPTSIPLFLTFSLQVPFAHPCLFCFVLWSTNFNQDHICSLTFGTIHSRLVDTIPLPEFIRSQKFISDEKGIMNLSLIHVWCQQVQGR